MRRHHDPVGRFCRPAATRRATSGRRTGAACRHEARPAPDNAGAASPDHTGYVRFIPSQIPVLTCEPAGHPAILHGAVSALARLGRSDLGGVLQVRAAGAAPDAIRVAAGRAVENALRGGSGWVALPPAGTAWTDSLESEDR
ncbi:hypothetical protein ACTOB_003881 [Actinoplanes oblitus]|uniref:Histidine kinase/HSP90-like ATPase domain-containing protein n=1 Tax=Actinoplanes oblitus TaxID=3040509 RepID=A0ABY8WT72_9ACTN|nr:hypothetical protein [Actinoplanes oblitus]WIN00187.1 hypothetical protein ACTOB_003881 [Actinoplanes oblitus]